MSKRTPLPRTSSPSSPRARASAIARGEPLGRERVLAADVEEASLAARGEAGDGHRLDDRERILLHQHAVLERARLGLVGVADDVVRAHGRLRDGLPLAPRGESRAAATDELRVVISRIDARGAEVERAPQRLVAAVRAVIVEARGSTRPTRRRSRRPGSPA